MDFDNILIEPVPSSISSRSEVNLVGKYPMKSGYVFEGIPIVASNMSGIGTFDVARILTKNKMLTCLVKTYSADDIIKFFEENEEHYDHVMMSVGVSSDDLEKLDKVMSVIGTKMNFLCMDVANGYMNKFVDAVKAVNSKYPHLAIIAGNVVTDEGAKRLAPYVSVIKVGLGSGSLCKTRLKTGVGVPQVTAIENMYKIPHDVYIMSDGGCKYSGDIAKALVVGADFVMLGTMLSGTDEGNGKVISKKYLTGEVRFYDDVVSPAESVIETRKFVEVYGSSSETANIKHFGGMKDYKTSEGITALVPYKGPMQSVVNDILGGVRSACSYSNSLTLEEFSYKATVRNIGGSPTHSTFLEPYKVGD